ncbi:MAG: hypothetical protein FJ388_17995 [Verrucomicrobia bacterium]|nr:hypothetical protein [Verrucomicrobiota bacterium]
MGNFRGVGTNTGVASENASPERCRLSVTRVTSKRRTRRWPCESGEGRDAAQVERRQAVRRRCAGQTLPTVAITMLVMIAILGLVIDVGLIDMNRRHAQRAADSAAQAGAFEMIAGYTTTAQDKARAAATAFAVRNGADANSLVIEIPPAGGAYAGSNRFIRVGTVRPTQTTFMRVVFAWLGLNPIKIVNVPAKATAGTWPEPISKVIYVLDPDDRAALKVSGLGAVMAIGGGIAVNSDDPCAVSIDGGGSIITDGLEVVGGVDHPGSVTGSITTGIPHFSDPLANVPLPQIISETEARSGDGTLITTSPDSAGTAKKPAVTSPNGTVTLHPGIYWGGIHIGANQIVTLEPGLYIMGGGGFVINSSSTVVSGNGVVIYTTQDPYKTTGAGAFADSNFTGGTLLITAPNAAEAASLPGLSQYKGLLLINDRASDTTVKLGGQVVVGSDTPLKGFIYNPNGPVTLAGGTGSAGLGVITAELTVTGGGTFGVIDRTRIPDEPVVKLVE